MSLIRSWRFQLFLGSHCDFLSNRIHEKLAWMVDCYGKVEVNIPVFHGSYGKVKSIQAESPLTSSNHNQTESIESVIKEMTKPYETNH